MIPQTFNCRKTFTITVLQGSDECLQEWQTASVLPIGLAEVDYAQQVVYNATIPNLTYELTDGTLPPGLSCSSAGYITGIPTTPGTYPFTITATDGSCVNCPMEFSIEIIPQDIDCEWINEYDIPGPSEVKFGCRETVSFIDGAFWLLAATPHTTGECSEGTTTAAGNVAYTKKFGPYATDKQINLTMTGELLVIDGTCNTTNLHANGLIRISQFDELGFPVLIGLPLVLLELTHGDHSGDTGTSGVEQIYTGTLLAGYECYIGVACGITISAVVAEPEASVKLYYRLTDA